MGRKTTGRDILQSAKAYLRKARTVEALRRAQAVMVPLAYGMTMEQLLTSSSIGMGGVNWLQTNDILNQILKFRRLGKKIPRRHCQNRQRMAGGNGDPIDVYG